MYYFGGDASVFEIELQVPEATATDAAPAVVFPDKDFLFLAEFKRRGDDLLLLGPDDRTAIILDYFKTGTRSAILTVDGAGLSGATVEALTAANEPEAYAQAQAADLPMARRPIGTVEKVTGSATVMRNGVLVELQPGDLVSKGDVVQTASRSALVIKFNDGTVFGLSSDARIVLSEMIYAGDSSGNSALFTLVQGVIGFVAGRIAKTGDFKVDTPVATMAIRGTAVQTEISAASGTTKFSLLTEPDGKVGSFLLYYKNNPSRVIASVTDPSQSTIVSPVSPTQVRVSEVRKTSDAFQFENTFFRDLFQVFSSSGLKRGSSDTEGIPDQFATITLPAIDEHLAPFEPRLFRPDVLQRVERVVLDPKTPLTYKGIAIEDGPLVVVLDDAETGAPTGHHPLDVVPAGGRHLQRGDPRLHPESVAPILPGPRVRREPDHRGELRHPDRSRHHRGHDLLGHRRPERRASGSRGPALEPRREREEDPRPDGQRQGRRRRRPADRVMDAASRGFRLDDVLRRPGVRSWPGLPRPEQGPDRDGLVPVYDLRRTWRPRHRHRDAAHPRKGDVLCTVDHVDDVPDCSTSRTSPSRSASQRRPRPSRARPT